jgi:integrase
MKGAHRQAHERAGGRWAIYWYAWRGGPQIAVYDGATRAEADAAEATDEAVIALARAWASAKDKRPAIGQFGRVIVDYVSSTDYAALKPMTRKTKRVWLDRVRDRFGSCSADEVTMDAVSEWLRDMEAAHGKRARDHAKSALSSVAAWGRAPERPRETRLPGGFEPTKDFKNAYKAPPQDAWSLLDLERLTKARPGVRRILLVALNTGLRRADLCRVAWTNVDWQAGVIRLVTSKGERAGRRIVVPLTRPLRAVLQEIGPQREGPILRNAHGLAWSVDGMAHAVNIELKRLGVSGRLHGLRRSAATHLAQQGASSRRIAQVLGWSEGDAEAMAAIYVQEEAL